MTCSLQDWALDISLGGRRNATLEQLKQYLSRIILESFPTGMRPYKQVKVLMLFLAQVDQDNAVDLVLLREYFVNDISYSVNIHEI